MTAVPVEPSPCPWMFPDVAHADADDLVAMGADLEPGTLLAAYRAGIFPMPGDTDAMLWWSPMERGVLPLDALRVSRSLRQAERRMEIRVDTAFPDVIEACADPARDSGWIDEQILDAYTKLHRLGWAHSVEAWQDGELVGGLYGVAIGGLFAGESMFHRVRDASKVALVGLVEMLRDEHADRRLLDVQWRTPHLASLGVVAVQRPVYLRMLADALDVPLPSAFA
jgi:leucyl/phenylalanyl-tRNA--protein transferase